LKEIIEIKHGYAFKGEFFSEQETNNILVTPGNFNIGGGFKNDKFKYYSGEYSEEYMLHPGDLIVTMTDLSKNGDTLGYSAIIPNDVSRIYLHNQRIGLVKTNSPTIDKGFIYWLMRTNIYHNFIVNSASGTTVKHTSPSRIQEFEFNAPDISCQRRIADILSSLDDKIELNRQTNATLEAIAQAIFKEWFVDFHFPCATGEMQESELGMIPKGWRVGKLGELCNNKRKSVNPKEISPDTPYVGLEHIPRKSLGLISWGNSADVDSQKSNFKKFNILFGKLRPYFHKVCIAPVDGICSTDILVIAPIQNDWFSFCLNHLFSDEIITFVSAVADGTRMPRVDWQLISDYKIAIPPNSLLSQFNKIVLPLYSEIIENIYQIATLTQIRDLLLPKLMSGEIEI
jgi:type I restriction enzyme S subunit